LTVTACLVQNLAGVVVYGGASDRLEAGVHLAKVQRILGHSGSLTPCAMAPLDRLERMWHNESHEKDQHP
jgi:hypothetical protein